MAGYWFFPLLELTTAENFLTEVAGEISDSYPILQDELYLEFHRGCYTTHADQKRWNRRCEDLLYQAELFAALASILTGAIYRKTDLEVAWKRVLLNQFHDILPGSAIPEVYVDANRDWQEAQRVGAEILAEAIEAIASLIDFSPPAPLNTAQDGMLYPVIVFNPLNWQRSELVSVALPAPSQKKDCSGVESREIRESLEMKNHQNHPAHWQVYDNAGNLLRSQICDRNLLFVASEVPGVGYRVFWLCSEFYDLVQRPYMRTPIPHFTSRVSKKLRLSILLV